ncbi:hypothetical protein KL86SPO_50330 [uncultured Sporomusa sp.]|uniref:Uncharacterized protein n=1 Tax=uncultured Sporomusa sp. TaxID=307249 RepID=A0A212LYS9_9FIRM|nr:hypothetical protein [uncultured Sporomusa sp.]SCM82559.1 hypothetical protein KL86SPO_50330 [uncultured Sporomusa sp.]
MNNDAFISIDKFYEHLDRMIDESESLEEQLHRLQLTKVQALAMMQEWQTAITHLAAAYDLPLTNKPLFCCRLESLSPTMPLTNLLALYTAVLCDTGLLFYRRRLSNQDMCQFLVIFEKMAAAKTMLCRQAEYSSKFEQLKKLNDPFGTFYNTTAAEADIEFLIKEFEHCFSLKGDTAILRENFVYLCEQITANYTLLPVAPILLYQIIRRNSSFLQVRRYTTIIWKTIWKEQVYKIEANNDKNFRSYRALMHFFLALCQKFSSNPAVNIAFNHYLFSRLSNLNEWYYRWKTPEDSNNWLEKPFSLKIAEFDVNYCDNALHYDDPLGEFEDLYYGGNIPAGMALKACIEELIAASPNLPEEYLRLHTASKRQRERFIEQIMQQLKVPPQASKVRQGVICQVIAVTLDVLITEKMTDTLVRCGHNLITRLSNEKDYAASMQPFSLKL